MFFRPAVELSINPNIFDFVLLVSIRPQTPECKLSGMKILVTGASGFIGFKLCKALISRGHTVLGVDAMEDAAYPVENRRRNSQALANTANFSLHLESWPSESSSRLLLDPKLETIVNLAAIPGLSTSWMEPEKLFRSNSALVQDILKAVNKRSGDVHLVHASTSSVYGREVPEHETGPLLPVSPYGVSKLAAENLISVYSENLLRTPAILRLFSIYGPGQRSDMGYYKFIDQALRNEPITITGSLDQSRRNTYVDDAVEAFVSVIESGIGGTFNVVGDEEVRLGKVVQTVIQLAGHSGDLIRLQNRPGDQQSTNGSNAKLKALTGWNPKTNLQEGIESQLEWQRSLYGEI